MRVAKRTAVMMWSGLGLACLFVMVVVAQSACQPRERDPLTRTTYAPPPSVDPLRTRPVTPIAEPAPVVSEPAQPQPRVLPPITGEPLLQVLVARANSVQIQVLGSGQLAGGGSVGTGNLRLASLGGDQYELIGPSGRHIAAQPLVITFPGAVGATFEIAGDRVRGRRFAGGLFVWSEGGQVSVSEMVPMESYLLGVISREVEPDWPLEALKAQAVAARSYATSRYLERHDQPWQLDASEQVDMAYGGWIASPHQRLATAVAQTRGDLLWYQGQALPAFFSAASGGHSEDFMSVWPKRKMPDGVTSPAGAFAYRLDPWDAEGRAVAPKRLGAWSTEISLTELRSKLIASGLKNVGPITDVLLTERDPGSGRARRVRISWNGGKVDMTAHGLRMSVGSTKVKSTLWRDFRISGGSLIVQGHGYGHGIGMPQASAWAMAKAGRLAPQILAQYYPGAQLVRKW